MGDGVCGPALRQSCQLQELFLGNALRWYALGYGELPYSQGASFIKGHNLRFGQGLQVVAALD